MCRCGSTRRAQSAGGARRDLRVSDLHKGWPSDGAEEVALFLPFGSSKERQSAAKAGIRRNRKTARFCAGGRKVRQRSAKGGKARLTSIFPPLQKPPRFGPVSVRQRRRRDAAGAVNRRVAGSNPASGANFKLESLQCVTWTNASGGYAGEAGVCACAGKSTYSDINIPPAAAEETRRNVRLSIGVPLSE